MLIGCGVVVGVVVGVGVGSMCGVVVACAGVNGDLGDAGSVGIVVGIVVDGSCCARRRYHIYMSVVIMKIVTVSAIRRFRVFFFMFFI